MSKMCPSPIFEKHIFPAENAGNMSEKRFLAFSRDFIQFFSDFLLKDLFQECSKHDPVRFSRKVFFRPKMPEIYRKSLKHFVVVSHKNINDIAFFRPFVRSFVRSFVLTFIIRQVQSTCGLFIICLFRASRVPNKVCLQYKARRYECAKCITVTPILSDEIKTSKQRITNNKATNTEGCQYKI